MQGVIAQAKPSAFTIKPRTPNANASKSHLHISESFIWMQPGCRARRLIRGFAAGRILWSIPADGTIQLAPRPLQAALPRRELMPDSWLSSRRQKSLCTGVVVNAKCQNSTCD